MAILLWAYFDESGTDGRGGHTTISGLVGPVSEWSIVGERWRSELGRAGVDWFHYVDCNGRNKHYRHFERGDVRPHLDKLAAAIAESRLQTVMAAYSGGWESVIKDNPERAKRFPTAYSFCFELAIQRIVRCAQENWVKQPLAVIFADQEEYSGRALDVWKLYEYNHRWPEISHFGYSNPRQLVQLQAADMIAWESRRVLASPPGTCDSLPLLSRLLEKRSRVGNVIHDVWYNEKTLNDELGSGQEEILKIPPGSRLFSS